MAATSAMTTHVVLILLIMAAAYAVAKARRLSVELSILAAAVAGGLAGAVYKTPPLTDLPRHLVEGTFPYLDVMLVFSTATIFMAIVGESGGVNYVVRGTIRLFYNVRLAALFVLMIIVLIPGALTGAGSVSLLVVGTPVALALGHLGIPPRKVAAMLFILAGLSAAAPPVNIWAMILCAGTAIPYVGFEFTLGIPVLILGTFTTLYFGWKREGRSPASATSATTGSSVTTESTGSSGAPGFARGSDSAILAREYEPRASGEPKARPLTKEETLARLPEVPAGMTWWRVLLPFLAFFGAIAATRIWPFGTPILGLPLQFAIAAAVALAVSPKKIDLWKLSRTTMKRLLPLLATMIVVGMLQQIMTATGVRGLLSYLVISAPLALLYVLLAVIIPVSEGVLTYGAAAILGIPLVWFFDSIGLHATVVIAGLSLLWPLGDGLPPTALIGRLSVMVSDYKDSYRSFLKATWLPWLVITATAILMIIFSAKLSFLVRWSM